MKKFALPIIVFCLSVCLCACSIFSPSNLGSSDPSIPETTEPSTLEKAQEFINNGQYEEAYALLYTLDNRTVEEENLLARFSFLLIFFFGVFLAAGSCTSAVLLFFLDILSFLRYYS